MPTSRFTRAALLGLTFLLAATVALLGGLSVSRKVESFQPVGFQATPEGAGPAWRVTAVDRPQTGLAVGDLILLVNGNPAARAGELAGALRAEDTVTVVVLRDGQASEIAYHRPPLSVDYPYLILALIGVAYLLIGLYTLFRDRRRPPGSSTSGAWPRRRFYLITPGQLGLTAPADAVHRPSSWATSWRAPCCRR